MPDDEIEDEVQNQNNLALGSFNKTTNEEGNKSKLGGEKSFDTTKSEKYSLKGAKAIHNLGGKLIDKIIEDPALKSMSDDLLSQMKETFIMVDIKQDGLVSKREL